MIAAVSVVVKARNVGCGDMIDGARCVDGSRISVFKRKLRGIFFFKKMAYSHRSDAPYVFSCRL